MSRAFAVALTAGAILWAAALVGAAVSHRTTTSALVYRLGSRVCHQRPDRSFALNGQALPVCARCAGLYFSGALGAVAAWWGLSRAAKRSREILLLAVIPTLATIPVEWLGFSPLSNVIRAVAALPLGAAAGWTFVRALRSEYSARPEPGERIGHAL
jgi:uncharacterized membrane protein